ncbi:hypothetical protein HDE_01584 [Halotydeus destructor]|nr:hypothetical protein HDE_01584 [Halotydeus destructor]
MSHLKSDAWFKAIEDGMRAEAITISKYAMTAFDSWPKRKLHIERHFNLVFGKEWNCSIGEPGSFTCTSPETAGTSFTHAIDGAEVCLYRTTKEEISKATTPVALDEAIQSMSKLSINLDGLLDGKQRDTELLPEELALLEKLANRLRLAKRKAKQLKRQSAEQGLVFHQHSGHDFSLDYETLGVIHVAIAKFEELDAIAEYVRKYFSKKQDSFRWRCVIVDKVKEFGCSCDLDWASGRYCFFSARGLTFFLTWAKNKRTDSK